MSDHQIQFTNPLLDWFKCHGRKDLPWQASPSNPYFVWLSEMMLQQTQVITVIPYFNRFIKQFPKIEDLAKAKEDELLALWSGLGYYSRCRYLWQTAQIIVEKYHGSFPDDLIQLMSLPGIGPSTAAAIASLAFNKPTAILDGNVKRVLSRYFLISGTTAPSTLRQELIFAANICMSKTYCKEYTQAIMDLGATICKPKQAACHHCPVHFSCQAFQNKVVDQYPEKQKRKIINKKELYCLILTDKNSAVYVEKRPPSGIWSGLWCPPILNSIEEVYQYLFKLGEKNPFELYELIEIKHRLTHLDLTIKAIEFKCRSKKNTAAESSGQYIQGGVLESLGLAKPIKDILSLFFKRPRRKS